MESLQQTGWYTEKYRRDEDDIDGQIKKMYLSDIKEAHEKLPQMTATIRGQDMRLDDRMNKLVWGGKAHLDEVAPGSAFGGGFGGGATSRAAKYEDYDDDNDESSRKTRKVGRNSSESSTDQDEENDGQQTVKRKKKRKKRKDKRLKKEEKERLAQEEALAAERKKIFIQSTAAGVAIGAVAVLAMTVVTGGANAKR